MALAGLEPKICGPSVRGLATRPFRPHDDYDDAYEKNDLLKLMKNDLPCNLIKIKLLRVIAIGEQIPQECLCRFGPSLDPKKLSNLQIYLLIIEYVFDSSSLIISSSSSSSS
ncbi:hypothetical protein CEXT_696191 [Caerostris extrusa]|uniref:Uncharacterized protein n=1 Tax=Caerostris extrusa TaxID=172846 RepID=A0AAV4XGS3_CAEEX|nr:hypothetical protein CEXT_696191 [Caerostris extrusa]